MWGQPSVRAGGEGRFARAGRGSCPPPHPQGAHSPWASSHCPVPRPAPPPPRPLGASAGQRWGRCWGLAGRPHGSDGRCSVEQEPGQHGQRGGG